MPHILIVEARFYDEIADDLLTGALAVLGQAEATFRRITVPGVLEAPAAVAMAIEAARRNPNLMPYDGFIILGCVIRGASDHYEHVCREAMRGLQDLAIQHHLALGNGILTVHSLDQATERADPKRLNIGGLTARACLSMIDIKKELFS